MIGELDLMAATPTEEALAPPRPGLLGWSLAGLIVVTVVAVDPYGLVPTGPLRWTAIAVTTGLAIAALVLRPIAVPRVMTGLWVALLAVLLVATLRAVDPLSAWIGTPDRRLGLLTWCTFPALFLAGHACTSRPATRVVLRASTLAALVLGIWSAAELLGHPPMGLEFASSRAGGPFGQPAYLGAACLLLGPLALATAFDDEERTWWRRAGALGVVATAFALAASQTRAAWLGALVAIVVFVVRRRRTLRRYRSWIPAVGAVFAVAFVIAVVTPLGARATSAFDVRDGTSASRLDEWRTASRTVADHPFLGVGPEGYRVVFPQEVDAAYVRKYGVAVFPDRAHNGVLDVALSGGVFAGLLYAALLAFAAWHAWRAMRGRDRLTVALGAAVVAYIVQQLFLFPLAELDPVFWVVVGMLFVRTPGPDGLATVRARWLVVPVVLATTGALVFGAREVAADRALKRAVRVGDARAALRDADAATRMRPDSIRGWYVAARIAQRGEALTDVDAALDRVLEGLDRSPRDPALRVLYGDLLVERAARSRLGADIAVARRELARLAVDAPNDPRLRKDQVTAQSLRQIGKP
jgi:O-antigen ligase